MLAAMAHFAIEPLPPSFRLAPRRRRAIVRVSPRPTFWRTADERLIADTAVFLDNSGTASSLRSSTGARVGRAIPHPQATNRNTSRSAELDDDSRAATWPYGSNGSPQRRSIAPINTIDEVVRAPQVEHLGPSSRSRMPMRQPVGEGRQSIGGHREAPCAQRRY